MTQETKSRIAELRALLPALVNDGEALARALAEIARLERRARPIEDGAEAL